MATVTKKKCRQYSSEYLAYGFIHSPDNITKPLCLICMATLSNDSMRPSNLKIHLENKHKDKKDKTLDYFKKLRDDFQARSTIKDIFSKTAAKLDKGLIASYEISKLIAKLGKPHTIGEELILPSVSVVISTIVQQNPQKITEVIPLSNNTVSRHIDEMAKDVEEKLVKHLQVKIFALQIDESLLRDNEALLMAYVRFLDNDQLREEMLFARSLVTDTKGETIFKEVVTYFKENDIPLGNIMACATDGAAAMVGRYRGFIAHLKEAVPKVFCIHCVVHRQHLIAKNLGGRLKDALDSVIKAVNLIKSDPLQGCLFRQLCASNEEGFERLLLHTEVRWLSKGNCLRRFVVLWDSIALFLDGKQLGVQIIAAKCDIFYLSDIFEKLNVLNKQLQGKNTNILTCKEAICAFLGKIKLFRTNIGRKELIQFPTLLTIESELKDDDILVYIDHLEKLHSDMEVRFTDLLEMDIPDWVVDPFGINAADIDIRLQESLIELQSNQISQAKFKHGLSNLWTSSEIAMKYPLLWDEVKLYFIAFPTSYLVESGFSKVSHLLSKAHNRLEIVSRGDLRLSLTTIDPDIEKLAKLHESQGLH